jgi:hypothetical protein
LWKENTQSIVPFSPVYGHPRIDFF